jgi:PTH1 family peptidyl-tRNA hydrolase
MKIKKKGGHGGHKGVESIIEQIGSTDFLRVKLGIDKPWDPEQGADYVLSSFSRDQLPLVKESVEQAAQAIEAIILVGKDQAMNRYNQ